MKRYFLILLISLFACAQTKAQTSNMPGSCIFGGYDPNQTFTVGSPQQNETTYAAEPAGYQAQDDKNILERIWESFVNFIRAILQIFQ